jgi:hypothetical protein
MKSFRQYSIKTRVAPAGHQPVMRLIMLLVVVSIGEFQRIAKPITLEKINMRGNAVFGLVFLTKPFINTNLAEDLLSV